MASAWGVSWGLSWGVSWGDSGAVVEEQAVVTGGWLSEEQVEAYRSYLRELEDAQERPRKERKRIEKRIEDTIRNAYLKATGQEKEVAEAVIAAVAEVAPASVKPAPQPNTAPRIDWRAFRSAAGAIERVLALLDRQTAILNQRIDAEREAQRLEALDEEEAVIMLLLAA